MKKFLSRDYLGRTNSSLSCFSAPQGLFPPAGCISSLLFFTTGIISAGPDSSLACSFSPQGLFQPDRFISILLLFSTGIISASQIHLYLALLCYRDYFGRPDSSLACSFFPQGLFRPARFISILLLFSTGIISASRIHLYLALFLHRDYFGRPDSSLSCSFSSQGLFRPARYVPSLKTSPPGHSVNFRLVLL